MMICGLEFVYLKNYTIEIFRICVYSSKWYGADDFCCREKDQKWALLVSSYFFCYKCGKEEKTKAMAEARVIYR